MFCSCWWHVIVTFNLWLHFNKLLTYLLTYLHVCTFDHIQIHVCTKLLDVWCRHCTHQHAASAASRHLHLNQYQPSAQFISTASSTAPSAPSHLITFLSRVWNPQGWLILTIFPQNSKIQDTMFCLNLSQLHTNSSTLSTVRNRKSLSMQPPL